MSSRLRDPKVWFGIVITVVCIWLTLRGVDFSDLAQDMARANWLLLVGASVPCFVVQIYLRALRWRHLTDPITSIETGPLFRATAVGFMANNLIPLRVGELIRAWYLARETAVSGTALFATVILERVIDSLVFMVMLAGIIGIYGTRFIGSGSAAIGIPLLFVLATPLALVIGLRMAPERVISAVHLVCRPFPAGLGDRIEGALRRFAEGLGAVSRGGHLFWIAFHSALIWLVAAMIPFYVGIVAVGIDLGSPWRTLAASYVVLTAVGLAVAVPSAPGFFGPYHLACKAALARFGVAEAPAVAMGTLTHLVFWVTMTAMGLLVLRMRRTSLDELEEVAADSGKAPATERR